MLNAIAVESRAKVDQIMELGLGAGGQESRAAQDYGWMYGRALEDLDGHIWEIFWQDISAKPKM